MTVEDTRKKYSLGNLRLESEMFSLVFEGSNRRLESGDYLCKNSSEGKYKAEAESLRDAVGISE